VEAKLIRLELPPDLIIVGSYKEGGGGLLKGWWAFLRDY